jgi:hypothetical protein
MGFTGEAGIIQEFVAIQHALFVPVVEIFREKRRHPTQTQRPFAGGFGAFAPSGKGRTQSFKVWIDFVIPPVFPRKKAMKRHPGGIKTRLGAGLRRQGQITDGNHTIDLRIIGRHTGGDPLPVIIAETVKLLDIANGETGLFTHEGAQGQIEGAVTVRQEWPRWQGEGFGAAFRQVQAQDQGFIIPDRHHHSGKFDGQ